jgi:hypothetical protein
MTRREYKKRFTEDDAVGWQYIDKALQKLYGHQKPQHFAPVLYYSLGGDLPLDGISVYESNKQEEHFHFITYGFSELYYNAENAGQEFSKWEFELTFRLKKVSANNDLIWAGNLLQNLAKHVFKNETWFEPFQTISVGGPIKKEPPTEITALAFVPDPELDTMQTPHGDVQFLQLVGLTTPEYKTLDKKKKTEAFIGKMQASNPLLITDLARK